MFDWTDFTAGWIGGIAGIFIGYPMDTIKTRQQTLNTTAFKTIVETFRYEGVRGFYKGMLSPLLTVGPINAVFFGAYGKALQWLQNRPEGGRIDYNDPKWKQNVFIAGCIGGFAQCFITCPVELIKTQLQIKTEGSKGWSKHYEIPFKTPWGVTKFIFVNHGITGLFKGLVPTFWRDVIPCGGYFLGYQWILNAMNTHYSNYLYPSVIEMFSGGMTDMISSMLYMPIYEYYLYGHKSATFDQIAIAGGVTGIVSWFSAFPFDVIKARIQADDPNRPKYKGIFSWMFVIPFDVIKSRIQADNPDNPIYKGTLDCISKSLKVEGPSVFFKGFGVSIVRAFPVNAAIFYFYEITIDLINDYFGKKSERK